LATDLSKFAGRIRASRAAITIDILYEGPPLWSSGQSYWLQIRRPGFYSWHYEEKK
jgi:hypothetical protein